MMMLSARPTGNGAKPQRSLSKALLRRTLALAFLLGLLASLITFAGDLQREKLALESRVLDVLTSAVPSAASAVYDYDQQAAVQVVRGLMLQNAVTHVQIFNGGHVMVDEQRTVVPTLPQLGFIGAADVVAFERPLHAPGDINSDQDIGRMLITIDRSLVAPEVLERLLSFVLVTTGKNVAFGVLLYWLVFNVLARQIARLNQVMAQWRPGDGGLHLPLVRGILRATEVDGLHQRFSELTALSNSALKVLQESHDSVLVDNSELSQAVSDRTQKLEEANERLQHLADHDGLTGLKNRASFDRYFAKAYEKAVKTNGPLEVVLIDVDHFKAYNDFYGHQAGDKALATLADILRSVAQRMGCFLARYGGEEFVGIVMSASVTANDVAHAVHRALEAANIEHQHSTVARRITVSIGTASFSDFRSVARPDVLVSAADDALYEAKFSGRNRTVASTPEIRAIAEEKRLSVQALLHAVEERAFEPYVQPQVDARTGEVVGAEALARWVQDDGKVVAPGGFMDIAEKTGLIKKIDMIILDKIQAFLLANPDVVPKMSFNVTGENLRDVDYVTRVVDIAGATGVNLVVELLETAFLDQPDDLVLWHLDTLRDAGVEIHIDDFGTGRSSIMALMAIRPQRLKIARELVMPLGQQKGQRELCKNVIEIAKLLDMDVIAEGVETTEAAQIMVKIGCPVQQGYVHYRPISLDALLEMGAQSQAS
ncbi:bifunctional diguanylate cyclase/phosphodiesterase [Cognatishimia sp. SS12]|uniref:putative bifunctional diguanylate cyclase/phosphodiesterase n=1 Tax=Cognatishimia sp. SS12 TaxID=2979465 RepID=UPI00232BCE6E|nr:bifunctional diguanylate cyclase/phosphodiesterase [Cognatishimia sp. SS12]MDC0737644.1 bifunctional diguanylate cyclase/phosphodiesterase [Cognatishimia sp. SS12]